MIKIVLEIVTIVVIVYLAGGAWSGRRKRRFLTERDYCHAGRGRAEASGREPHEDPLLRALDIALYDGVELPTGQSPENRLPPDEQKG